MKAHLLILLRITLASLCLTVMAGQSQSNLLVNTNWTVQQPQYGGGVTTNSGTDGHFSAVFRFQTASISQTILTTPGSTYRLTFRGIQFNGTNHAFIKINGVLFTNLSFPNYVFVSPTNSFVPPNHSNTNWDDFDFHFRLASANTTISFTEQPEQYTDSQYNLYSSGGGLDSFALVLVTVLSNPVVGTNGSVTIQISGAPASTNITLMATNSAPPIFWQAVGTNIADTNGAWVFTDLTATNAPARFYRPVTAP